MGLRPPLDGVSHGAQFTDLTLPALGDDTVHAVANPPTTFTGALHVYGGDITKRPGRSEWDEQTGSEVD